MPSSVVTVATTRPGVSGCSPRVCRAEAGAEAPPTQRAKAIPIMLVLNGGLVIVAFISVDSNPFRSLALMAQLRAADVIGVTRGEAQETSRSCKLLPSGF